MPPSTPAARPSLGLRLLESRALAELYAFGWSYPWLHLAPRGDGHPVLVLPGFMATGTSTAPLRHILKRLGYRGHRWKLGRNLGPVSVQLEAVAERLHELRARYGQKVSIIGWSLGGVYARELAWLVPDDVRLVITLGSPLRDHEHTTATWLYRAINASQFDELESRVVERARAPLPVPSTSIYSRGDGIVPWTSSLDRAGPYAENVRVYGSHCGLGHNPAAVWVMLDRLAQAEGEWAHFERNGSLRWAYPASDAGLDD